MKEIHDRFNSGKETLEDLLNYYPNFKMKIEYKGKEKNIEVVEKKYYQKLINIVKKQNKVIEEMADMISNLDFKINMVAFGGQARFGSNEEIKQYFKEKVEENK